MSLFSDALGGIGYALDTPGALTRGLLSGHAGERVSPREMLQHWGAIGDAPDDSWLSFGRDLAVGAATDPLTYLGALGGAGAARSAFAKLGPQFGGGAAKLAEAGATVGRPAEMAESLLASPHSSRLLGEIPQGSSLLEGSNNALAFKTPQGDVLRMAQGKAGVPPASRAAIPEMLQPTRNVPVGDWRVERVPFADRVGDPSLYRENYRSLADGIRAQGGHPADLHPWNVGADAGGKAVVIDPGAVIPYPKGKTPLPFALDQLGSTPGNYLYPRVGAGAGIGGLLGALGGSFGG